MSAERKLVELSIDLPTARPPAGVYRHGRLHGGVMYLAGKVARAEDGGLPVGKLGREFTTEDGRRHARLAGLNLLAAMRSELGSLDRVKGVLKVFGMVNATDDFGEHTEVINGCSELFVEVFGEAGLHARSAVGMGSLPEGTSVEIEVIVAVRPDPDGGGR